MTKRQRWQRYIAIIAVLAMIALLAGDRTMALEKQYFLLGDLDLNDGNTYAIQDSSMPPPPLRSVFGGDNIFRDGSSFIEKKYNNRVITLTVLIRADSHANLRTAIRALYEECVKDSNTLVYRPVGCTDTADNLTFDILGPATVDIPASPDGMWQGYMVSGAVISLTAKPFARGAEVQLQNQVKNASFQQDTNGDGVPDYWAAGGTATITRDTAHRKYGIRSAHLVGAADQDALTNNDVAEITVSATDTHAFTCWAYVREGTLKMAVKNASTFAIIESTSATPNGGWTRYSFTFTPGTTLIYVDFLQDGATNVDAFIDGVYTGTHDTVPAGWCSYMELVNHTDNDAGDVGYFDVADVPGDVPAGCRFAFLPGTGDVGRRVILAVKEGDEALLFSHIWEAEDIVASLPAQCAEQNEATASGGKCVRFTPTAADQDNELDFNLWSGWGTTELMKTYAGSYFIYARVMANASVVDFGIKVRTFVNASWSDWTDEVTDLPMNQWGMVNLGRVDLPPGDVPEDWSVYDLRVDVNLRGITGNNTLDVDYIWLVPADGVGFTTFPGYPMSGSFYWGVDTINDPPQALTGSSSFQRAVPLRQENYVGHYHYAKPNTRARFVVIWDRLSFRDNDNEDDRDFFKELFGATEVTWLGQGVKSTTTCAIKTIWLYMKKVASPTDNMTLYIYPDTGGLPDTSGSPITNGTSGAVAMSGVDTDWEWVAFTFATAPSLTADTQYHLVLKSDQGAADATNYIAWACDLVGHYPSGNVAWYGGAAWTAKPLRDYLFKADMEYLNVLGDTMRGAFRYRPNYLLVP